MKQIKQWSNEHLGRMVLIVLAALALGTALLMGVSDNVPGLILVYLACGLLIVAFVCTWREPQPFLKMLIVSLISVPVFVVLHNLAYAVTQSTLDTPLISGFFEFLGAICFIIAMVIAPTAVVISAIGSIITALHNRGRHQPVG
ncbi:MAG: hypothetical protein HF973_09030 [Chloroflexi bacterium]|nr:hypothetical protein [Chloroflexota bacterium]